MSSGFWTTVTARPYPFPERLRGLPGWARVVLGLFALPAVILLALSIVAIIVSLLALLLLTVPVYLLLKRLTGADGGGSPVHSERVDGEPSPGVKRVEATVVD